MGVPFCRRIMIKYTIICPSCNEVKTLEKEYPGSHEKQFCTRSCANSANAKVFWNKPNAKQVASERAKKQWDDPEKRREASERAKKQWKENYDEMVRAIQISHQTPKHRQYASERATRQWENDEYRKGRSRETKELWESPKYRGKQKVTRQSEEYSQERKEIANRTWADPEIREKRTIGIRQAKQDPEYKQACSDRMKKMLDDPAARKAFFANLHVSPNQPELALAALLKENGYNNYEYTGDRSFWLGRRNPDFTWHEGHKIIEMFGSYWHDESEIEPRTEHFANYGYKTLIIWDYELDDKTLLLKNLKSFHQKEEEDK